MKDDYEGTQRRIGDYLEIKTPGPVSLKLTRLLGQIAYRIMGKYRKRPSLWAVLHKAWAR